MGASIFIARILGPCCIVVGVGILMNRGFYRQVMEDCGKNAFMVFFAGMVALIVGLVVVLNHNIWIARWPVIITIYGWGGVIKGIWLIVFPKTVASVMDVYIKNERFLVAHSIFVVTLGAVLSYIGYIVA